MVKVRARHNVVKLGSVAAPTTLTELQGSIKGISADVPRQTSDDTALGDRNARTYQSTPLTRNCRLELKPTAENFDLLMDWDMRPDVRLAFEWAPAVAPLHTPREWRGTARLLALDLSSMAANSPMLSAQVELQDITLHVIGQPSLTTTALPATMSVRNPAAGGVPVSASLNLADYVTTEPPAPETTVTYNFTELNTNPLFEPCADVELTGSTLTATARGTIRPHTSVVNTHSLILSATASSRTGLSTTAALTAPGPALLTIDDQTPNATGWHVLRHIPSSFPRPYTILPGYSFLMDYVSHESTFATFRWTGDDDDNTVDLLTDGSLEMREANPPSVTFQRDALRYQWVTVLSGAIAFTTSSNIPGWTDPGVRYFVIGNGTEMEFYKIFDTQVEGVTDRIEREIVRLDTSDGSHHTELIPEHWRDGTTTQIRLTMLGATYLNECDLLQYSAYVSTDGSIVPASLDRFHPTLDFPAVLVTNPAHSLPANWQPNAPYEYWAFPTQDNRNGLP